MTDDEKVGVVDATLDNLTAYTVVYERRNICIKAQRYYLDSGSGRMIFLIDHHGDREVVASFPDRVAVINSKFLLSR